MTLRVSLINAARTIVRQVRQAKPYLSLALFGAAGMPVAMAMDGGSASPFKLCGLTIQGPLLELFNRVVDRPNKKFREEILKEDILRISSEEKFQPGHLIFFAKLLAYHGRMDEAKAKDCASRDATRLSLVKQPGILPEPPYSDGLKDLSREIVKAIEENLSALVRARAGKKVVDGLDDYAFKNGMRNTSGSGWFVICGITYNEYSKAFVELLEQKVKDLYS